MLTNLSTEQMVGLNGQGYTDNMSVMGWEVGASLALIIVAFFFLPRYLKKGYATIPDFIGERYDNVTVALCHCIDGNETIKDDLNATQYTLPKKSNFLRFLLVLLFLAAVFFVCYYFNAFNLKSDIVPSNVDSVMVQKQDTMQ